MIADQTRLQFTEVKGKRDNSKRQLNIISTKCVVAAVQEMFKLLQQMIKTSEKMCNTASILKSRACNTSSTMCATEQHQQTCLRRHLTSKPECNLLLCIFNSVTAMDDITSDFNAVVATNGARLAGLWVGSTNHLAASCHNILAFPHLGNKTTATCINFTFLRVHAADAVCARVCGCWALLGCRHYGVYTASAVCPFWLMSDGCWCCVHFAGITHQSWWMIPYTVHTGVAVGAACKAQLRTSSCLTIATTGPLQM